MTRYLFKKLPPMNLFLLALKLINIAPPSKQQKSASGVITGKERMHILSVRCQHGDHRPPHLPVLCNINFSTAEVISFMLHIKCCLQINVFVFLLLFYLQVVTRLEILRYIAVMPEG